MKLRHSFDSRAFQHYGYYRSKEKSKGKLRRLPKDLNFPGNFSLHSIRRKLEKCSIQSMATETNNF